jgi:hypothetical protein
MVAQRGAGHSGSIQVSATVVSDRLSAAAVRPVSFTVARHRPATTVRPTESAAGEWRVTGLPNAVIRMKLALPATLVNSRDPAAARLPVAFLPTSGRWRPDVDDATGATSFDPKNGFSGRFGPGHDSALYVWLGGSVQPASDTATGFYQGDVTLTVFYY